MCPSNPLNKCTADTPTFPRNILFSFYTEIWILKELFPLIFRERVKNWLFFKLLKLCNISICNRNLRWPLPIPPHGLGFCILARLFIIGCQDFGYLHPPPPTYTLSKRTLHATCTYLYDKILTIHIWSHDIKSDRRSMCMVNEVSQISTYM